MNGTARVTGCSHGGNCGEHAEILDEFDLVNLSRGGSLHPLWCGEIAGNCAPLPQIGVAADATEWVGSPLFFVVLNADLIFSQTVAADLNAVWLK